VKGQGCEFEMLRSETQNAETPRNAQSLGGRQRNRDDLLDRRIAASHESTKLCMQIDSGLLEMSVFGRGRRSREDDEEFVSEQTAER
jgi:hypothetical protein